MEKIKPLKRYITSIEKLELLELKNKYQAILAMKFYESKEEERRIKWNWLHNSKDGKRFRQLQYKRAKHNIARRLTDPGTIGRDFDHHTIEIYEIERQAPRGFNVYQGDRSFMQNRIFREWKKTPDGKNWAELRRNIALMQRKRLRRCKIEISTNRRVFTYKKKWEKEETIGFNTFFSKKSTSKHSVQKKGGRHGR